MKTKILSDSTCDLSPELIKRFDIEITRLSVVFGSESLPDGAGASPEDIYTYVEKTHSLPKTSAVNEADYRARYQYWHDNGYEVVQFCISSKFSSCCQNACAAAKKVEGVYVVDSCNLSSGQGLLVMRAAELAAQGMPAAQIAEECRKMVPLVESSFVIDTLEHLYKGGRCSALALFGANLLHIKPCIEVIDGAMTPTSKYKGSIEKVMLRYVRERLTGRTDIDMKRIMITHSKCSPGAVEAVRQLIRELQPGFEEILETDAGAVVTTHCGPGTLGILFMRKA